MKRQNRWFAAFLALSAVALGQEPNDDERVELKVVGPTGIQVVQDDELDNDELPALNNVLRSFILGVEGQDEKDAKKQDDGTIVKEIDLGDGRKMKIIISTTIKKGGEHGHEGHAKRERAFTWTGPQGDLPGRVRIGKPDGDFKVFHEGMKGFDPHGFDVQVFGGEVKEHMERAMKAFDRAREEFIRAFNEGEKVTAQQAPRQPMIAKLLPKIEAREAEKAEKVEADRKEKVERDIKRRQAPGDVQFLGVSPGAASKQAREMDELRKEIKELEKMVRELKEQMSEKSEKRKRGDKDKSDKDE